MTVGRGRRKSDWGYGPEREQVMNSKCYRCLVCGASECVPASSTTQEQIDARTVLFNRCREIGHRTDIRLVVLGPDGKRIAPPQRQSGAQR